MFGPHVVGREYDTARDLHDRLAFAKGNGFAKAAVELCWWTLESKLTGTPVHRLLGGESRPVIAGADFGVQDSIDMLLGNMQQAVDAGFPRHQAQGAARLGRRHAARRALGVPRPPDSHRLQLRLHPR